MINLDYSFDLTETQVKEVEEKYALLEPLLDTCLSPGGRREHIGYICNSLQISKRTVRRYLMRLKKKGITGLIRKKRADAGEYRKFADKILVKAKSLLEENPYRSVPMLITLMQTDETLAPMVCNISPQTLYMYLKRDGHNFSKKDKEKANRLYHRFEAEYPNQLWQGDARHGIFLPHPDKPGKTKQTYLFSWIDDFSRKILYAKYYWDEKLPRLEDCFRQAVLRWGLPEKIYCDNGSVYISKQFFFIVTGLKIRKIHHPAYSAWCKGKVENCMKVIKGFQREAKLANFKTIEELNSALTAWIDVERNKKVLSTTGETPDDRFRNNLHHPVNRVKNLEEFDALFFWRDSRIVDKYGKIRFQNNKYSIKGLPAGSSLGIRFDPFDLSEILIFHNDAFFCKTSASILTTKTLPNIPEEKRKPSVSKDAVNYFQLLRKKHLENVSKESNDIHYSNLNKKESQTV